MELGLERYGPANRGHQSVFGSPESNFPIEIPARLGKILAIRELPIVSEHVLFLTHPSLWITFSELERICARVQHPQGEKCEIFNIVLFHPLVFVRTVDVAPDLGFRRSWFRWKACATFFPKVLALHRGELGFARYDPANRGCRSVFHDEGSFFDLDSALTGEAFDDPRVARCS